ncbi:MAG: DUF4037 domain-containing protein [Anaerolineae bacterium]|nr:DUF4037 domain-containing protein [Anaerolineae bacterium]
MQREFPSQTAQMAFGVFGYGSEVLRLDDAYSRDHHWGLRINAVMPEALHQDSADAVMQMLAAHLPASYHGHSLREGYTKWAGLELTSLESYLERTIGLTHAPQTYAEWLSIPEEDILHIVAGEVWHDPSGRFSAIREVLNGYYPEPVRIRRLAHWCRFFSGMGTYALRRAILRDNAFYAVTRFSNAIRLGVQMAFLLDKRYFPYDKWLYHYFAQLPRMARRMKHLVDEAVQLETGWQRKLDLLDQLSDVLDAAMVEDGLLNPHPKFHGSVSSGYRLMEYAYAELIQKSPPEIKTVVPVWDQVYMERFHSGYVDGLDMTIWRNLLNLRPVDE